MRTIDPRRAAALVAMACIVLGCGGPSPPDQSTEKIPITTSSEEARSAYIHGRDLFEALRFTDSNEYFVTATELDPDFAIAWMAVANTSATTHDFFAALRHASATAGNASPGEQMMIRAFEAAVAGDPVTQRAELQALVTAFPGDERAHNALGNFLFGQQEFDAAIKQYREAIKINPDFSQPHNQLGYSLRFLGDFEAAEKVFVRYIELIPDQPNPYDSYAELLMKMGRFEESIESYRKAMSVEPTFIASTIGIANNQIFLGRPEDARATLAEFEKIARTDGERRQMCTWAAASYLHQGDFESAIAEVQRRYDVAAETDDRPAMSGDLTLMGNIQLRSGRVDEAEALFQASVAMMDESDATDDIKEATRRNSTYNFARIALWKGDLARAAELATTYRIAVEPHDILFERQQSRELDGMVALAGGNPKAALFEFANANQQNPQVLLLNARAFAAAGDREAARAACRQVIDFNQLNFNLAYVRGTAFEMIESL